ncbi:MAG: flagellar biosynthetic protein FliO, partial [bacterium]
MKKIQRQMKRIQKSSWIGFLMVINILSLQLKNPSAAVRELGYVQDIKIEQEDVQQESINTRIIMEYKGNPKMEPKHFILHNAIVIELVDSYINPPKRNFPIKSSIVKRIDGSQYTKDTVKIILRLLEENIQVNYSISKLDNEKILINLTSVGEIPKVSATATKSEPDHSKNKALGHKEKKMAKVDEKEVDDVDQGLSSEPLSSDNNFLGDEEPPLVPKLPDNILSASIRVVASLAIVMGLILLTFFFLKKYKDKANLIGQKKKVIKVIGSSYLGYKKSVSLVEMPGRVLVLGITNNHISL